MNLIIAFTDQSQSFTNGVELGLILAQMMAGRQTVTNSGFPAHADNIEVLRSACEAHGYIPTFGPEHDGWVDFFAIKKVSLEN